MPVPCPRGIMSDNEFLIAFDSCTIPKALWTHEAHVRVAWLCLSRMPFPAAVDHVRNGIDKYNRSLGNVTGYHDTVTVAFVRIIAAKRREGESFAQFRDLHPELFSKESPILLTHYTKARLDSEEARAAFVEADLRPLPPPPPGEEE
jgi:hypothetical protein